MCKKSIFNCFRHSNLNSFDVYDIIGFDTIRKLWYSALIRVEWSLSNWIKAFRDQPSINQVYPRVGDSRGFIDPSSIPYGPQVGPIWAKLGPCWAPVGECCFGGGGGVKPCKKDRRDTHYETCTYNSFPYLRGGRRPVQHLQDVKWGAPTLQLPGRRPAPLGRRAGRGLVRLQLQEPVSYRHPWVH